MKKTLFLFALALFSILLVSSVSAFMPPTHDYVWDKAMQTKVESNLYNSCNKYKDLCYTGNVLSDVSVVYYYTNFKRYEVTHSPAFCTALLNSANTDEEKACAVGACTHQPNDIASHTEAVPWTIQHTLMPNGFIHVLEEQHVDNWVVSNHPEAATNAYTSLQSFQKCVPLFKRVLEGNKEYNGVNMDDLFSKFVNEVQSSENKDKMYGFSYTNVSAIPFIIIAIYLSLMLFILTIIVLLIVKRLRFSDRRNWLNWLTLGLFLIVFVILMILFVANLYGNAFGTFITMIKPIANWVPTPDIQTQLDHGVNNQIEFMKQGELWLTNKYNEGIVASGTSQLTAANNSIMLGEYLIFLGIIIVLALIIYFNFKGGKKKSAPSYGSYNI
jgi:hypothetical protein